MISNIKARKLLSKGCIAYLTHVVGKDDDSFLNLQSTLVVCEFQDMFLDKLLRLTPEKKVEFSVELVLGMALISKYLYRMALAKHQELKK